MASTSDSQGKAHCSPGSPVALIGWREAKLLSRLKIVLGQQEVTGQW